MTLNWVLLVMVEGVVQVPGPGPTGLQPGPGMKDHAMRRSWRPIQKALVRAMAVAPVDGVMLASGSTVSLERADVTWLLPVLREYGCGTGAASWLEDLYDYLDKALERDADAERVGKNGAAKPEARLPETAKS